MLRSQLGPLSEILPAGGHPVGNAAAVGWALRDGVYVDGARVDALAAAGGAILRTSAPTTATQYGLGLVLRSCESPVLRIEHLLFAPVRPRPLLLACVNLQNLGDDVLLVRYSELWDLPCREASIHEGACSASTARERTLLICIWATWRR